MSNLFQHKINVTKEDKNKNLGHKSPVIWFTGLSGSGKSTIANTLEEKLFKLGIKTHILDGDNVRMGLNKDLGFSEKDRGENIRRIAEVAKLFSNSGTLVMTAFISPIEEDRELARQIIGVDNFIEIFVNTEFSVCEERDTKGLYKKARAGEILNFTGLDSPFEHPANPDLTIDTENEKPEQSANSIFEYLIEKEMINFSHQNDWTIKNYGGNPMGKGRAVFVGRWQPYHNGHTSLIRSKINQGIPILILVRDIPPDERNPFTTEQTVSMIKKYHNSHNDDVEVMVIPDIESLNFGRGVGYEVNYFTPPDNIANISATKIRESIKNNDNHWKDIVDPSIHEDVIKYLNENLLTN